MSPIMKNMTESWENRLWPQMVLSHPNQQSFQQDTGNNNLERPPEYPLNRLKANRLWLEKLSITYPEHMLEHPGSYENTQMYLNSSNLETL